MGYANGIITDTNLCISDVKSVIGSSSNVLSTLCTHQNVNAFSKYKPMKIAKSGNVTDSDRRAVNWGYVMPDVKASLYELINYIDGWSYPTGVTQPTDDGIVEIKNLWYYQKPTGGSSSPYRLGDFRGYNNAVPKELFNMSAGLVSDLGGGMWFSLYSQGGSYQVGIGDLSISDFNGLRFAVAAHKKGTTVGRSSVRFIANPIAIATGGSINSGCDTFTINQDEFDSLFSSGDGVYRLIPFLTTLDNDFTVGQNATAKQHLLLPNNGIEYTVDTSAGTVPTDQVEFQLSDVSGDVSANNYYLDVTFTLSGRSLTSSATFARPLYYRVILSSMDGSDILELDYVSLETTKSYSFTNSWLTMGTYTKRVSIRQTGHNFTSKSFKWLLVVAYEKEGQKLPCDTDGYNIYER